MIDPGAAVDAATVAAPILADPELWIVGALQLGPLGIFLVVLYKLLQREQTSRDATQRELIETLKRESVAMTKLEGAITGLSSEVSALRRMDDTMQRQHEDLRTRVDTHATRLDDHDRRIRAHEYSEPAPAPRPTKPRRDTPGTG